MARGVVAVSVLQRVAAQSWDDELDDEVLLLARAFAFLFIMFMLVGILSILCLMFGRFRADGGDDDDYEMFQRLSIGTQTDDIAAANSDNISWTSFANNVVDEMSAPPECVQRLLSPRHLKIIKSVPIVMLFLKPWQTFRIFYKFGSDAMDSITDDGGSAIDKTSASGVFALVLAIAVSLMSVLAFGKPPAVPAGSTCQIH